MSETTDEELPELQAPSQPQPSSRKTQSNDIKRIKHLMDVEGPAIERRARVLLAIKELLEATEEGEHAAESAPPLSAPATQIPPQSQQRAPRQQKVAQTPKHGAGSGTASRIGNVISVAVLVFAVVLYLAPELIIGQASGLVVAVSSGRQDQHRDLHPEWPLQTFESASGRKSWTVNRAVVSDTLVYDKVVETLSYHLVHGKKRVLCMWHLAIPLSTPLANVCVWKRRPTHTTIASLLLSRPNVDEGLLLPLYNLDIKGYSLNATTTVTETSIMCRRSRLVARKRRPVVDIAFETVKHWHPVRLLVDAPDDSESAFALQQAWEEGRGYKCDHEY